MSIWHHVYLRGEYPERERILRGLQLADVSQIPAGATHSIYQELWHSHEWQRVVLTRDRSRYETWMRSARYPVETGPEAQADWDRLVADFLENLNAAIAVAEAAETDDEFLPGVPLSDALLALAVHNAYHLGKIVALRQRQSLWSIDAAPH